MATIKKLEDINVWQLARDISKDIYRITKYDQFSRDIRFVSQIRAAAGSIMDNIAEGFGREGNKEFVQFLSIANGSCMEVKSQLYRALDAEYINSEEFTIINDKIEIISLRIKNFSTTLKNSNKKGLKFVTEHP